MANNIKQDSLWKGIIEDLFDDFLHYLFPDFAQNEVDFSQPFEFLDKELAKIILDSKEKQRTVDKLVKVFTKSGIEKWCLIHIEVQGYKDDTFEVRMFEYFIRIRQKYNKNITVLAVYTDENPHYHPKRYAYQFLGTELEFKFNTFKLLEKTPEELDIPNNPFSLVMLAAYNAIQKDKKPDKKQIEWKFALTKRLLEAGYTSEKIRQIYEFIRYCIKFSSEYSNVLFEKKLETIIKTPKNMGIIEAILEDVKEQGIEQGIEQGKIEGEKIGELKTKIKGIQKALLRKKLSIEEIADLFEVEIGFVHKVQNGEIK